MHRASCIISFNKQTKSPKIHLLPATRIKLAELEKRLGLRPLNLQQLSKSKSYVLRSKNPIRWLGRAWASGRAGHGLKEKIYKFLLIRSDMTDDKIYSHITRVFGCGTSMMEALHPLFSCSLDFGNIAAPSGVWLK